MELPPTELRKILQQEVLGNNEFMLKHVPYGMPVRNPSREFTEAAGYPSLDFAGLVCSRDRHFGVIIIR